MESAPLSKQQTPRFGSSPSVAVLIPCHNEEATISAVVSDFRTMLPQAQIYVYDNNSTDRTHMLASDAGAVVRKEPLQGKGEVVRRMFADIEADAYVLVDGDDTYDAGSIGTMLDLLFTERLDMVTAIRTSTKDDAYRRGHRFGNYLITGMVRLMFGNRITDVLSGYRVFSRRFVKSFPALATGFETETEISVHALELRMPISEVPTLYESRPEGSQSKLHTVRDGVKIVRTIISLVKEVRPLQFFAAIGLALLLVGIGLGFPVVVEFLRTGLVPRLPTAVLSASIVILSFMLFASGLVLDSVAHGRRELKRLAYLSFPWMSYEPPLRVKEPRVVYDRASYD